MALHQIDRRNQDHQRSTRCLWQDRFRHQRVGKSSADQIEGQRRTIVGREIEPVVSNALSGGLRQLAESAEPLIYRLAAYFMMSLLDDTATLQRFVAGVKRLSAVK